MANNNYIVADRGGSNPAIMKRNDENGTYRVIGYGAGEDSTKDLLELIAYANRLDA